MSSTDTPVTSFEIEIGGMTLVVPDTDKAVWFGPYQGGKLAIYEAIASGAGVIPNSLAYISSYIGHGGPDFMFVALFKQPMTVEEIIATIQERVFETFKNNVFKSACGTVTPPRMATDSADKPTLH